MQRRGRGCKIHVDVQHLVVIDIVGQCVESFFISHLAKTLMTADVATKASQCGFPTPVTSFSTMPSRTEVDDAVDDAISFLALSSRTDVIVVVSSLFVGARRS